MLFAIVILLNLLKCALELTYIPLHVQAVFKKIRSGLPYLRIAYYVRAVEDLQLPPTTSSRQLQQKIKSVHQLNKKKVFIGTIHAKWALPL